MTEQPKIRVGDMCREIGRGRIIGPMRKTVQSGLLVGSVQGSPPSSIYSWENGEAYDRLYRHFMIEKIEDPDTPECCRQLAASRDELLEALEWYEAQVSDCDRDGFEGDAARSGLAKDSGKMARAAIAKARGQRDG